MGMNKADERVGTADALMLNEKAFTAADGAAKPPVESSLEKPADGKACVLAKNSSVIIYYVPDQAKTWCLGLACKGWTCIGILLVLAILVLWCLGIFGSGDAETEKQEKANDAAE